MNDGSGSGSGHGSGYGSGHGYGDGDGDGDGSGNGDGDGSGSDYGDGSCYGYGSGYDYGSGYGVKEFNSQKLYDIDGVQTLIYSVKGDAAKGAILNKDLTLTPCWVYRRGNLFAHGATLHEAAKAAVDKWLDKQPTEERIKAFVECHPSLTESYGDLFDWHHTLTGSCEFGRQQWCKEHGLKPADSLTLREFFELTKDDYGGDIIRQTAEAYGVNLGNNLKIK